VQLERPDAVNRAIRRLIEPKHQDAKAEKQQSIERGAALAARLTEMPWLQYYDSDVPQTVPPSKQLLHEMLSNAAHDLPERPAIIFFRQKIRYAELDLLSNRFAHVLRRLGVQVGDRVAILLPNVPQCVIAFYGTLKAGAIVVLGSPLSNEEEIAYQIRDSGSRVLLTLSSHRDMVERLCVDTSIQQVIYTDVREYLPLRQRVLIASLDAGNEAQNAGVTVAGEHQEEAVSGERDNSTAGSAAEVAPSPARKLPYREYSFQRLLHSQSSAPLHSGTSSDDLALLQYTSGTTDMPKGVMLSHGNLMVNVAQTRHWIQDAKRGREIVLCVLPLSHSYGITSCMNYAMATAASLVLLPTGRTEQILKAIKEEHPSIFPGVPALYLAIANYPRVRSYGVSAIRVCISGSAPLPVEVQEAFEKLTRGHLVEGYGLTEASPVTHSNPLKGERRVGSIGIPMPGTSARIVDLKTDETLGVGEVGELVIRGPQVMQGYWNQPKETSEVVRDGWLHTGDLARMDEDGFFTIVDRKKDLILSGAYNVYPRDVEEVLYEHPKVLEAAVVSTQSGENGANSPFIKAVVVLKRGEKATADELLALCRERLDAYKVPEKIEFRNELPKNLVGKVLRRLLVET
jgi:long-chain acyl-CoA synthetase